MLNPFIIFFFTFVYLSISQNSNFDYDKHGDDWNCPKDGPGQSPIQLKNYEKGQKSNSSYLFCDFSISEGSISYLNTTIYIKARDSFGTVYTQIISGESIPFKANEIRLRMHSQHKTPQGYSDLQVQIFHPDLFGSTNNYKLAIGLLFYVSQESNGNSFIQEIINSFELTNQTFNVSVPIFVNLAELIGLNMIDDFWFYLGSATIPPCSDSKINWVISRKKYAISKEQNDTLTTLLSWYKPQQWTGNFRNIQNHNDSTVGYRNISELIDVHY